MRDHRTITYAGTGSFLAASIAIASVLLVPTPAATINAATIFASLHETMTGAFRMTLKDVGIQNIHVNGEVVVVFDDNDYDDAGKKDGASAMYFDMHVRTDETHSPLQGLDFVERGAFSADQEWIYARANAIPKALLDSNPDMGTFVGQLERGVLLELSVLSDVLEAYDPETNQYTGSDLASKRLALLAGLTDHSRQLPWMFTAIGLSADAEVNALMTDLVAGRADPEDFNRFTTLLEETAGFVEVTPQSDDTYLLKAGAFKFDDANRLPGADALLGRMTLEIAYDREAGLLWAVVDHIGTHDGSARFKRAAVRTNDPMFSNQRYREDDRTTVLDESTIASLLGLTDQPDK